MVKRLSDIGEFGLIASLRTRYHPRGDSGIGDDAAVLPFTKDKHLLLTTDMLVEGVHFTLKNPAKDIGHKALACSVSDIAAMGGTPTFAVVSLGLPPSMKITWVEDLYTGMNRLEKSFEVAIVGGDTVKSRNVVINIALLGEVFKSQLVTRCGAKKGDWIFVTGPLGGSLKSGRHLTFTPRVQESQYLVKNFKPTAMIDISDGLSSDLGHILEESKVGAVIYEHKIPKNHGAQLKNALYDGEDFELLCTVSPAFGKKMIRGKRFHFIGEIMDKRNGLQLVRRDWKKTRLLPKGYTHF